MPARAGDYLLIFRPLKDDVPASVRLKRLLKCARRAFGLENRTHRELREGDTVHVRPAESPVREEA